jgi:hypothetical protein
MNSERRGKAEILYATYEPPSDAGDDAGAADKSKAAPGAKPPAADQAGGTKGAEKDIYYNFSPALVLSDDRLMLCSTKQIAEELADLAANKNGSEKAAQNTLLEISARPLADLLTANREQLIAQNMLEKGHTRQQAEKEIDVFLALVNAVRDAKVSLTPTEKTLSLDIEINTAPAK